MEGRSVGDASGRTARVALSVPQRESSAMHVGVRTILLRAETVSSQERRRRTRLPQK